MTRLDRYILIEILGPFIFALVSFTSIFAGSSIIPIVSKSVKYGFPFMSIIQLILYKIPPIVSIILPMAVLLAVILTFSRFSSDQEIIAFRSAGISFGRLLVPVICFGFVLSATNLMFNEIIVPKSNYNYTVLRQSLKKTQKNIQNNINLTEYDNSGLPSRILNIREVNGYNLNGVTVAEFSRGNLNRIIRADSGLWQTQGGWILFSGTMHSFSLSDLNRVLKIEFEQENINIDIKLDQLRNIQKSTDEMSWIELKQAINVKKKTGQDALTDEVALHLKVALPMVCLIFAILGACVGVRPHRSASAVGFGLSLAIIIMYYILYSISVLVGNLNILPPIIVAWIPNLFVALSTVYLLRRVAFSG